MGDLELTQERGSMIKMWESLMRCRRLERPAGLTLSCPGMGRAVVKIGHSNLRYGSKELSTPFARTGTPQIPNYEQFEIPPMRTSYLLITIVGNAKKMEG